MTSQHLIDRACDLEQEIRTASEAARQDLHQEFARILRRIEAAGVPVPGHLRRTEQVLNDELVESQFDNMPI
jgi:serine/threonine-protein kinase RIO1